MQAQDFNTMQAQAINRAREMQRRATPQRNPEPRNLFSPTPPPPKKEPEMKTQFKKQQFPPIQEIFGHHNPWTQTQQTPFCNSACPIKSILGIGSSSDGDNDIILLMAVLLLISADGSDKMLMLALLYIMT